MEKCGGLLTLIYRCSDACTWTSNSVWFLCWQLTYSRPGRPQIPRGYSRWTDKELDLLSDESLRWASPVRFISSPWNFILDRMAELALYVLWTRHIDASGYPRAPRPRRCRFSIIVAVCQPYRVLLLLPRYPLGERASRFYWIKSLDSCTGFDGDGIVGEYWPRQISEEITLGVGATLQYSSVWFSAYLVLLARCFPVYLELKRWV